MLLNPARWRLACEIAWWRHGAWPVLMLALLSAAAWLHVVERADLQHRLAVAGAVTPPVISAEEAKRRRTLADDVRRLAHFRAVLPSGDSAAEQVQHLVALTLADLAWKQAEFQHTEDKPMALQRLQISVPVAGTYPRLRAALDTALRDMPNLSIDQVLFQRQSAAESDLQARVRLSLWFAAVGVHSDPSGGQR